MNAYIKFDFLTLFLYENEIEDDYVYVDRDCLDKFYEGDQVEILKEIPAGEYAKDQKSYVIFNPKTFGCITVAASFVEFK